MEKSGGGGVWEVLGFTLFSALRFRGFSGIGFRIFMVSGWVGHIIGGVLRNLGFLGKTCYLGLGLDSMFWVLEASLRICWVQVGVG